MIKGMFFLMLLLMQIPYSGEMESGNFNDQSIVIELISPIEISKIDDILNNESGILDNGEKQELNNLQEKIKSFQVLSQEEVDFIRECELKIIKTKLGEEKFQEYCNLIKKREGKEEFDQDKRFRLLELERELK